MRNYQKECGPGKKVMLTNNQADKFHYMANSSSYSGRYPLAVASCPRDVTLERQRPPAVMPPGGDIVCWEVLPEISIAKEALP